MKYTISSLLGSAALVAAHGYVENATIGGEAYTFYQPYQDPYMNPVPDRVSRAIQGNGPVEDLTSIDIQCGGYTAGGVEGSQPAKLEAKAAAGSDVTLNWTLWPDSHMGPTITYMAKCPDAGCTDYLPGTDAVWFKIQESGREGTSSTWGATPLMKAGNSGVKYTIPECIAPGHYLVRHEIIALHAAYAYPGAQFYPGCHQIEVTGSGSTTPSELVAFPGAYSETDPGIVYDAYKAQEYTVPGPAVFTCSGSGSSSSSGSGAASSAAPVASSAAAFEEAVNEEDDCPAESSTVPVASAIPTPTQAADDDDEDCPAESSAAPVASATPTQPADDDEDDCPAESEAPVASATPTQPASDDDEEEDCPVETAVAKRMSIHERRSA